MANAKKEIATASGISEGPIAAKPFEIECVALAD